MEEIDLQLIESLETASAYIVVAKKICNMLTLNPCGLVVGISGESHFAGSITPSLITYLEIFGGEA